MTEKSFVDLNNELRLIAYIARKDYRICDEVERDVFSITGFKKIFDIISSNRTTMSKEVLRSIMKTDSKNKALMEDYLTRIYKHSLDKVSARQITAITDKLVNYSFLRKSLESVEEIIEKIEDENVEEVKKASRKLTAIGVKKRKSFSGEYLSDFEERKNIIKARMNLKYVGIPTGIKKFDEKTGGLMKSELGIIISESGMGKSIALENFGIFPWDVHNKNILFVSIEMPKNQVQFRMDSRVAMIKYDKFRKGDFSKEEILKWEKKINVLKNEKKNFFEIVSLNRGCSAHDVEEEAYRVQDIYGLKTDLIIVDYLNIMKANRSPDMSRDWKSQVDIAWELKELATEFNAGEGIPVWTANQVTDDAEDVSLLKKKHVKYGRGILEVSNLLMGLVQTQDDELENVMRLQTLKARDLKPMREIILRPNFDIMMLHNEHGRL